MLFLAFFVGGLSWSGPSLLVSGVTVITRLLISLPSKLLIRAKAQPLFLQCSCCFKGEVLSLDSTSVTLHIAPL